MYSNTCTLIHFAREEEKAATCSIQSKHNCLSSTFQWVKVTLCTAVQSFFELLRSSEYSLESALLLRALCPLGRNV